MHPPEGGGGGGGGGGAGGSAMQMINCLGTKRTTMAEIRYAPIIGNRGASHGPAQQTRP